METIIALFEAVFAYCAKTPFHAVIVIALTLAILALIAALIAFTIKGKRDNTNKTAGSTAEKKAKPTKLVHDPILDQPPEEYLSEEFSEEALDEETDEEPQAEAPPTIDIQVRPIKKSNKKKKPTVSAKPSGVKKTVKNKNNTTASKEGTMLHDELKDINTDLDFYEEDEADRVARYSGKWVICRVVTNDSANEDTYFFELHASNGELLLCSEEYTSYNGALRGIETHKANILRDNFRISLSKKGDYIFKLLNGKGMLLCMGEHYATKANCESAIESAKRFARTAFIDENIQDIVVKVPAEDPSEITPLPDGYNGKWIIDCHISPEGEKVFFFELFANNGERLLSSEEYATYIGAVNGIQTHKVNIKNGNFRVFLTKHGDYIYKLLNGNGQLLCLGEHYKTKRGCENAVESVKRFAMNSPVLADPELMKE